MALLTSGPNLDTPCRDPTFVVATVHAPKPTTAEICFENGQLVSRLDRQLGRVISTDCSRPTVSLAFEHPPWHPALRAEFVRDKNERGPFVVPLPD